MNTRAICRQQSNSYISYRHNKARLHLPLPLPLLHAYQPPAISKISLEIYYINSTQQTMSTLW